MISIQTKAPQTYKDLVWGEFFLSRGRGISLSTHFPWIDHEDDRLVYLLSLDDSDTLEGGLVVRLDDTALGPIGSVGLVCVCPSRRRQGVAGRLLRAAIDFARSRKWGALRLWTSQHHIYRSLGFEMADNSLYGTARLPSSPSAATSSASVTRAPAEPQRGLPPFATGLHWLQSSKAALLVLDDAHGQAIVEWRGADPEVIDLMEASGLLQVRLNGFEGQTLMKALTYRQWILQMQPTHLQMIFPLDAKTAQDWANASQIPLTERI